MASSVINVRINPGVGFLLWWSQLNLIPSLYYSDGLWKELNTQHFRYQNSSLNRVSTPTQIFNAFARNWHIDHGKVYIFVMLKVAVLCILCSEQQSLEEYPQIQLCFPDHQNWFSKKIETKITNWSEVFSVLKQF